MNKRPENEEMDEEDDGPSQKPRPTNLRQRQTVAEPSVHEEPPKKRQKIDE